MNEGSFRYEFKYLISAGEMVLLKNRIACLMMSDPHAGTTGMSDSPGMYRVRSLYFDNMEDRCYHENLNGIEPREKIRVRIYNCDGGMIRLEEKQKVHGMTRKTGCPIDREQLNALIEGLPISDPESMPQLLRKVEVKRRTERLRPVVIVEYDRWPFVCREGNVRVTFDCHLSSGADLGKFLDPALPVRSVMPTGQHLMEVKYDGFLPDPIYNALNLGCLRQTSYSKYSLCRTYALRKERIL